MARNRTTERVFALLVIAVTFVTSPVYPANAACDGSTCVGLDPFTAGCSGDAITAISGYGTGPSGTIAANLRYSGTCRANWTVAVSGSGIRYIEAQVFGRGLEYYEGYGISVCTDMLDGTVEECAQGFMSVNPPPGYDTWSDIVCG